MDNSIGTVGGAITPLKCNLTLEVGKNPSMIQINFNEEKTILKQLKWRLFCFFFPLRITKWTKMQEDNYGYK